MKKYYVSWDERHSIVVEAENREEAVKKVRGGQHDFKMEQAEYEGNEEAWRV